MALKVRKNGAWVDIADAAGGITYDLEGGGSDGAAFPTGGGTGKIILKPSSGTDDEVSITAGTNVKIDNTGTSGFTISADSGSDTNTTYTLPLTGNSSSPAGSTGNGDAIWTLTDNGSPANTDPVKIKAGTNISISVDSANSEFTISASSGTATIADGTYGDIEVQTSGSDWQIREDTVGLTELSATGTTDSTTFLRGDNTWASPTSVTYDLSTVDGDDETSEKIKLSDGTPANDDFVTLAVTGNLTIERDATSNKITIDGSGAGSNTTYTLPVFGTTNGSSGIKLTPDSGAASACLLYTSPSPRDGLLSRMPSSA